MSWLRIPIRLQARVLFHDSLRILAGLKCRKGSEGATETLGDIVVSLPFEGELRPPMRIAPLSPKYRWTVFADRHYYGLTGKGRALLEKEAF